MLKHFIFGWVLLAAACVMRAAGDDSVLWWMFSDDTSITETDGTSGHSISDLVGRGAAEGKTVNAIRVGVYDSSKDSLLGYLKVADGDGSLADYYSMPGLTSDGKGGYADDWNAGPSYALYAPYATTANAVFRIELGNWDDTLGTGNEWLVMAHSDAETLADLNEFIGSDFSMQTVTEWKGSGYAVPEPSSGLLFLVGGALLALRRRVAARA